MGYESKIMFFRKSDTMALGFTCDNKKVEYMWHEYIAEIKMGKIDYEVIEAFDQDIDFYFVDCDSVHGEYETNEDKYGKVCKTTTLEKLRSVLNKKEIRGSGYWRYDVLRKMVEAFYFEYDIVVVHYGY